MNLLKTVIISITLLLSANALADDPIETGFFNNYAIYGYDTVAYFTDNKAVKGDKKITTDWRGAQWHFATSEHRDMFVANPEKYAPQYGGYCAYAVADSSLVGIDEDAFTIRDGKLYLNYNSSVQKKWLNNVEQFIKQADAEYPKLVDL